MAKISVESIGVRPNTTEENYTILRETQIRKEVDARKQDELNVLFDCINAECASKTLKEKRKALASPEKQEKVTKTVHYGTIPGFRPGKWWGIRMDCSRDCVHEPFNEDIHDGPFGAVSICTSHLNTYNDVDLGDILTFTSQKYSKTNQSKDSLILSYKNRVPIRLVRSYCLSNSYAPKTGYRYDGLYTVVNHWIGISSDTNKYNKFVLVRVLDQECPSWVEKTNLNVLKVKKSIIPRLTRSHVNNKLHEPKTSKFVYNKVKKDSKVSNVSAIVSRQVFKKFITDCPESSAQSVLTKDSAGQISYPSICSTKLCNTNLSIRTNLYDSSHKSHEAKNSTSMMFCRIFKSNKSTQLLQKNSSSEKTEKLNTEVPDINVTEKAKLLNNSITNKCTDKKIKKVTWTDSCNFTSSSIEKSLPTIGNSCKYGRADVFDGFSRISPKNCVLKCNNSIAEHLSKKSSKPSNLLGPSVKNDQNIVQVHSRSNVPESSKAAFTKIFHETEKFNNSTPSIDTLPPDELVNVIVKEQYHPMAKLLIGNMIGLENQESSILSAYNTLTSKTDQDDTIKSKENKIRNKFYIRNKSKKNAVIKKQRREITNLIIDAKFNPVTRGTRNRRLRSPKKRISKSNLSPRKLTNSQRIQVRNKIVHKEIRNTVRQLEPKKTKKTQVEEIRIAKQPKMVSAWTQCTLLTVPSVDQSLQVVDSYFENNIPEMDIKLELVDLDDIKSEPSIQSGSESSSQEIQSEPVIDCSEKSCFNGSAFAAVNTVNSSIRITQLRSIGFRPIQICSPFEAIDCNQHLTRPDATQEYDKYTSEENHVVKYMNEQLNFEDIEEEVNKTYEKQSMSDSLPQDLGNLSEHDFDKPWHGWRKISINGQIYWTGY